MESQIKKQTAWESWIYNLKMSCGLIYDPDNYPDAPKPDNEPTQRKPTKTPTILADDVTYNVRTGKYLRTVNESVTDKNTDKNDNKPTKTTDSAPTNKDLSPTTLTWEVLQTPTKTDDLNQTRTQILTKADKMLLAERGLDEAKAQVIKEYWFKKIPRNTTAKQLATQARGYSEAIIKNYYAVFNAATIDITPPTLQAK